MVPVSVMAIRIQITQDMIGHGTACIGVIHSKAPNAEFLPVKIFESELITTMDILCKAIYWCVEHHCHIINLSLGTLDERDSDVLKEACDFAHKHQTFIVAATSNDGQPSIPASFPNVFGVAGGKVNGKFDYFYDPHEKIQFVARGDRQRLNWLEGKQIFMGGIELRGSAYFWLDCSDHREIWWYHVQRPDRNFAETFLKSMSRVGR